MDESFQEFTIKVNSLPVITSLDSISILLGDSLQFYFSAYDNNPDDSLTYIIENKKLEMNLNETSGLLSWIPLKKDLGIHEFNLQVIDGNKNSSAYQKFKIFVYSLPVFTGDLLTEAFVGLEYAGFISGRDMYEKNLRED